MSAAIDSKLQKILKQLLAQKGPALDSTLSAKARELTSELSDSSYVPAVQAAVAYSGKTRFEDSPGTALSGALSHLKQARLTKSAEQLALAHSDILASLEPHDIVRVAPTAKVLEELSKKNKALRSSFEHELCGKPEFSDDPVLIEWFVAKAPPARICDIAPLLARLVSREPSDARLRKTLALAIAKDKSLKVLPAVLEATAGQKSPFTALLDALRVDAKAIGATISAFPKLAVGESAPFVTELAPKLGSLLADCPRKSRPALSRTILSVTGNLLSGAARQPAFRSLLAAICAWSSELESAGLEVDDLVLPRLAVSVRGEEGKQSERISPKAAALLGDVLEKLRKGFEPVALVEALLVNLGLEFIDSSGEVVEYDFRLHQDTAGGLVSGDRVEVLYPGVKCGNHIVLKSAVRAAKA